MQKAGSKRKLGAILALIACLALAAPVLARVSSNYDLSWHVIGGGGGKMASVGHTLQGTTGQALVGQMSGTGHDLCSGFWCMGEAGYRVYLPLVMNGYLSGMTPLFSDDFDHGTLTGWTATNGTWTNPGTYMRGEYTLGNAWNMHSSVGGDIVYEGTMTLISGNAVGLVFRSSADGSSSYDAILDAKDDVFKISKRLPYQVLASYSMTVQYNQPYKIRVVASGSTIDAYLDGQKLLTVTDTTYASGRLGVILFISTATYDDLAAWEIP